MKNKLNSLKFGIASGIIWSLLVLVTAIFSSQFPTWFNLFFECYGWLGYSSSLIGMFLGLIYGFIDGFVLGLVFAWIYNRLNNKN